MAISEYSGGTRMVAGVCGDIRKFPIYEVVTMGLLLLFDNVSNAVVSFSS